MSRRLINTITSALLLMGLGYVIAVSARTLPGQDDEGTLGEVPLSVPDWVGTAFLWTILTLAAALVIFLLWSLRRGGRTDWSVLRKIYRRLGIILLWGALTYLIWSRPETFNEGPPLGRGELPPPETAEEIVEVGPSVVGSWVAVALVALIGIAAVIRLWLVVRPSVEMHEETEEPEPAQAHEIAEPLSMVPSTDPRSRVVNAYAEFELLTHEAGHGRRISETARRHARRAGSEIGAAPDDIHSLEHHYEMARFAETPLDEADATEAEGAWQQIKRRMGR